MYAIKALDMRKTQSLLLTRVLDPHYSHIGTGLVGVLDLHPGGSWSLDIVLN